MSGLAVGLPTCRPLPQPCKCSTVQRKLSGQVHSAAAAARRSTRARPLPCRPQAAAAGDSAASASGSAGPAAREVLEPRQRSKLDSSDDRLFYDSPRLVHHLDAFFRGRLTQLYRQRIPEGADVLDLCSSWVSHLPTDRRYGRVVGHGLNAAELARNPQLTEFFVRNLNAEPRGWALADASVDAVLCCASVQYMQQPEAVFAEIARVLRPGGVVIIAFSNRMFYTKAIAAWRDNSDFGRCSLVKSYMAATDAFTDPEVIKSVELPDQGPLQRLQQWGQTLLAGGASDPFFAVVAHKR